MIGGQSSHEHIGFKSWRSLVSAVFSLFVFKGCVGTEYVTFICSEYLGLDQKH